MLYILYIIDIIFIHVLKDEVNMYKKEEIVSIKKPNKLLILGNGFDLSCDLMSKFSDFSNYKFFTDNKTNGSLIQSNIWYLLLYYYYYTSSEIFPPSPERSNVKKVEWIDIENFIKKILIGEYIEIYDIFEEIEKKNYKKRDFRSTKSIKNDVAGAKIRIISSILHSTSSKNKTIRDVLFYELKRLELDFCDYLNSHINGEYNEKAKKLLSTISENCSSPAPVLFIINFNYTNSYNHDHNVVLVHGSLEKKNVIFGIDCSDVEKEKYNSKNYRFSKAWRKINNDEETIKIPPKGDIDELIFYGHSLGEQDFSYFYSIFNYYDIYNSNIRLTFLYKDYRDNDEENENNQNIYFDRIFSLLRHYVIDSLGIKEANSFITKIELENRLIVRKIFL